MTLNELMIVVLIVSVTAGLAIPTYVKTVEKMKAEEAWTTLKLLRAAEKVYYFDNNAVYTDLTVAPPGGLLVTEGYLQDPNASADRAFDYSVVANATWFTAMARRRSGCNANETFTLDQDGTEAGTWTFLCGP